MDNIKVSIIVPVYNVDKYLENCIISIINQTLKEIEIIIIDDGSKDNSLDIIKKMAQKDNRIRFITRENKGVGITRNEGIYLSSGEYIIFVDSDDTIEATMCEKMYIKAKQNEADIVICDKKIIENGYGKLQNNIKRDEDIIVTDVKLFLDNYYYTNQYQNHVWDKMFRASIIKENRIVFGDLNEMTGEDTFFVITILPYCKKISFLAESLYCYHIRDNSIMSTYNPEKVKKTICFIKKIEEFQNERNLGNVYNTFLATYIYNLAIASSRELIKYKEYKKLKQDIEYMIENEIIHKYAIILREKEVLSLFKGKAKKKFANILAKWIVNKNNIKLYFLLILKFYI